MTYKPEQAQAFYAALTGMQNPPLVWQWFCDYDKERRDLAGWEYAYFNPAKLVDLQARGCGVFTSVNGSTTGGRGKNDIDIFRAVFMDSDGAPFPERWVVQPHAIVKRDDTHFHAYWFLDGDCSAMEWMVAQKQIALHYDSDESMVNPDRVMRVPGFLHQKSLDHRVTYELAELHADMPRYKLRDIIKHFTLTDEKVMKIGQWVQQRSAQYVGGMDDFDDNDHNVNQYIRYLTQRAEQSVSGQGGNHVLFKTAAAGRDYQLSPQKTYELMLDHWDARNDPPWGDEMWPTVQNVYKYSQNGVGARSFAARLTEQPAMLPGMSLTPVESVMYVPEAPVVDEKQQNADAVARLAAAIESGNDDAMQPEDMIYSANHTRNALLFLWLHCRKGEYLVDEGVLYRFNGKIYEALAPDYLKITLAKEMELSFPSESTINGTAAIIKLRLAMSAPSKWPEWKGDPSIDTSGLICFNNGVLDINTNSWYEHTHLLRIRTILPFDYDHTAVCPTWEKFMQDIWGNSKYEPLIEQLQMWFGYMLMDDTSQQKMLIMSGTGGGGKSTIMRTLNRMVGDYNCAFPNLNGLTKDSQLVSMYDKPVAILNDVSDPNPSNATAVVERIKGIVGEDKLTVDRKYLTSLEVSFRCRLNLTCNAFPRLSESSNAMLRRGLFFTIKRSFVGKEDLTLEKRLHEEMTGIINWAIAGIKKLQKVGKLENHPCMTDDIEIFRMLTSPLEMFAQDALIYREDAYIKIQDLCKRYRAWASANEGTRIFSNESFIGKIGVFPGLSLSKRGNDYVIEGAFLRPDEEPDNGILYE